jgi:hypothetical protein
MKIVLNKPSQYPTSGNYVLVLNHAGHIGLALYHTIDEKWYWVSIQESDVALSLISHDDFHWISYESID